MKISEIREMRPDELKDKLSELKRKVFDLRTQSVTETIENRHAVRSVRKDIAKIKTVIRQEELKKVN